MQKSLMKLLGMAVLTWSSQASAVSMGAINVSSALGEPLQAKIGLESVSDAEKVDLQAKLASPEAYKLAGLEYPVGINFKFTLSEDQKTILVTSDQPVSVPFVSLLIELTWASGKLQRDFTFLVDPVGYNPEQPKPAEAQPVAPQAADAGAATPTPVERQTLLDKPAAPKRQKLPPTSGTESAGTVTVHRGDTLGKVAAANRPASVSLERMIVAMYRVNADRFTGHNMNRVKAGTILRMPTQEEIDGVSQNNAKQEIQVQTKDWQSYRQRLAGAAVQPAEKIDTPAPSTNQSSSGKVGGAVTDKAPAAPANPNGMLKLSTGDAPTDKATTAQDRKNAKVEEQIAQSKAAQDAQTRAALAAKNAADAQHLIELKSQLAAASAAAASAVTQPAAMSGVAGAAAALVGSGVPSGVPGSDIEEIGAISMPVVASAAQLAKPAKSAPPAVPERSLVDDAMELVQPAVEAVEAIDPLYIVGGLGGLATLGGAAYFINRRRKQKEEAPDEVPSFASAFDADDHEGDTALPDSASDNNREESEETSSNTPPMYPGQNTGSYHTPLQEHTEDEEDPIEEARLFLSFGRDVQAEDILKDALKKTPNNHLVHLELLGIYANRKDVNAFAAIAHQLRDSGDESIWGQAAALGRKLEPNNTLYLGDGEQPEISTQQLAAYSVQQQTAAPMLDFDIGAFTTKRPAVAPQPADGQKLDINVASATSENPAISGGDATGGSPVVFDVTAMHPTIPPTQAFKADPNINMDFTMPEMPAMTQEAETTANLPEAVPMMDFNVELTLPPSKSVPPTADPVSSFSSGDIQFAMLDDLGSTPTTSPADPLSDFSTGNIGFALPESPVAVAPTASEPTAFPTGDLGFSLPDISLPNTGNSTATDIDSLFATPNASGTSVMPDIDSLFSAANLGSASTTPPQAATGKFSTAGVDFAVPDIAALTASMPALDLPPLPDVGSMTGSTSMKLDFGGLNLNIGGETSNVPIGESTAAQSVGNKLDLARVYIEMDDPQSAKELLEEVAREGSPDQVAEAQAMLKKI